MTDGAPAGWYADPTGQGEHRYWDGTNWTEHVSSAGQQSVASLESRAAPTSTVVASAPAETPASSHAEPLVPSSPAAPVQAFAATATMTPPIKVCPHCQVQSATAATSCPNCGKKFVRRKKWPWVLGGVVLAMVVGLGGCLAILSTAVTELNKEQARHAITPAQFDAVELGTSRPEVIAQLGKAPEDAQNFVSKGVLSESEIRSSCIYYNRKGGSFGDRYQFCFDGDSLRSKNAY